MSSREKDAIHRTSYGSVNLRRVSRIGKRWRKRDPFSVGRDHGFSGNDPKAHRYPATTGGKQTAIVGIVNQDAGSLPPAGRCAATRIT